MIFAITSTSITEDFATMISKMSGTDFIVLFVIVIVVAIFVLWVISKVWDRIVEQQSG